MAGRETPGVARELIRPILAVAAAGLVVALVVGGTTRGLRAPEVGAVSVRSASASRVASPDPQAADLRVWVPGRPSKDAWSLPMVGFGLPEPEPETVIPAITAGIAQRQTVVLSQDQSATPPPASPTGAPDATVTPEPTKDDGVVVADAEDPKKKQEQKPKQKQDQKAKDDK